MAAADDRRPDRDEAGGRLRHAVSALAGDRSADRQDAGDGAATSVKHNVERVADKVKELLRSRD